MANTYTQLYIHLVFAVEHRDRLIHSSFKDELMKYMTGIIQNKGNKLLAINTMPDHGHIFLGLNPKNAISDLAKEVKVSSTDFINEKKWLRGRFHWQEGYGAFSYSHSQIDRVVKYILNQEKQHRLVHIVTNHPEVQEYACKVFYDSLISKWFDDLKY